MAKLTQKEAAFVREYLIDLNAAQAAIRTGYAPASANVTACKLMKKPNVKEAIDIAMAERSRRTGISQDRVLLELARMAFVNPLDIVGADDGELKDGVNADDAVAIASIKVKTIPTDNGDIVEREVKMVDKIKPLELLGKHLGMFKDKLEVEIKGSIADRLKQARERRAKQNGADE